MGMPTEVSKIRRGHVEASEEALFEAQKSPATVASRHRSLRQLFRWLEEEGEITASPMAKMRPPRVPDQPINCLTDVEIVAVLSSYSGQSFEDRRDTALIRLFVDAGGRLYRGHESHDLRRLKRVRR